MRSLLLFSIFICILSCSKKESTEELTSSTDTSKKPNIIVILADDFGVGDIQAIYSENKIATPYLDTLVSEGMYFSDAHSPSAVCSPTRYGLITGRYNWRSPLQEWVLGPYEPPLIKNERTTLPEILKEHGYNTAIIGKWHLGFNWPGSTSIRAKENRNQLIDSTWDYNGTLTGGPTEHGFDYYFGTHVPNFPPFTYIENNKLYIEPTATYYKKDFEGQHMPGYDVMPMAPDWKFENILPEITNRSVDYIKSQAKEDDPFFLFFSMTSPHEPVSPTEGFQGNSGIAPIADFVMQTDYSVGKVLNAVKEAGIEENTLIIFTADNGHSHYTGWEKLIEAGHYPSGQFRGHKGDIWEGGHRVPFIVKWKGKVAASSSTPQLTCVTDILATCHDIVTEDTLPQNIGEDSYSIKSLILGESQTTQRTNLVSHSVKGEFSYKSGDWKIIFKAPEGSRDDIRGKECIIELYNLSIDEKEENECSIDNPEIVAQLTKELEKVVQNGTSKTGKQSINDVEVVFRKIQEARWADEI